MRSLTDILLLALGTGLFATAPARAQRHMNVITAEEIEHARPTIGTAYDAVRLLRPRWLRGEPSVGGAMSNPVGSSSVHVYLDNRDQGEADYLMTIPADRVEELRWMSSNEAGSRFGPSAGPGIVVTLKR